MSADVVTLHVPLNPSTRHLLDQNRLSQMKRDAVLINTSRGPVIDEAALVTALQAGRPGAAALDVYEHEPKVNEGLLKLPNVVLLPHIGSATRETRLAMAQTACKNIHAVLSGQQPPNPVGPDAGSSTIGDSVRSATTP